MDTTELTNEILEIIYELFELTKSEEAFLRDKLGKLLRSYDDY